MINTSLIDSDLFAITKLIFSYLVNWIFPCIILLLVYCESTTKLISNKKCLFTNRQDSVYYLDNLLFSIINLPSY